MASITKNDANRLYSLAQQWAGDANTIDLQADELERLRFDALPIVLREIADRLREATKDARSLAKIGNRENG